MIVSGNTVRKLLKYGRLADALNSVTANGFTISSSIAYHLIQACMDKKSLSIGKKLHCLLKRNGLLSNPFICGHLIRMYAACNSLVESQQVFFSLPEHDIYTWTAIISAHLDLDESEMAVSLYHGMAQSDVEPDGHLFVAVLRACSDIVDLDQGRMVHNHIVHNGCEVQEYVVGALIDMYSKCGSFQDGRYLLLKLHRLSPVMWNAIIGGHVQHQCGDETLFLFEEMQQNDVHPNAVTFVYVLKACSCMESLQSGMLIHNYAVESGFETDLFIGSILIDMYAKCGSLAEAQRVFERHPKHDLVTWSAIIAGNVQHGYSENALHLFEQMLQRGIQPNDATFVSVLKACINILADYMGTVLHSYIVECGYDSDAFVCNTLIDMHTKFGSLEEAMKIFMDMLDRGVVTWTTLIGAHSQHQQTENGIKLFKRMHEEAQLPNIITLTSALNACSGMLSFPQVKVFHVYMMAMESKIGDKTGIPLINAYTRSGQYNDAVRVFDDIPTKNVETWTAIVVACLERNDHNLASKYLEKMEQEKCAPDEITFICLLSACGQIGKLTEGCNFLNSMLSKYLYKLRIDHYNSMVNLLGGVGYLVQAEDLLLTMPVIPNDVGWTSLLNHCKTYTNAEIAGRCFNEAVVGI